MLKQTQAASDADKSPSHFSTIDTESVLRCTLELCTFLGTGCYKQQKSTVFSRCCPNERGRELIMHRKLTYGCGQFVSAVDL